MWDRSDLVQRNAAQVAFRGDQGGAKLSWAPASCGAPWARRRLGDHGAVGPLTLRRPERWGATVSKRQWPSPDGDRGPAPRPGTQKRVPGFVAPPFAQLAAHGDAGDPGALTQVFSVPVVKAPSPAPVAGAAIRGRWWASTLFVLSTGAALSKFDSALADRGPRTRPPLSKFDSPPSPPRRPWARQAGGSLTLARGKSAAPVAFHGDQGGAELTGASRS